MRRNETLRAESLQRQFGGNALDAGSIVSLEALLAADQAVPFAVEDDTDMPLGLQQYFDSMPESADALRADYTRAKDRPAGHAFGIQTVNRLGRPPLVIEIVELTPEKVDVEVTRLLARKQAGLGNHEGIILSRMEQEADGADLEEPAGLSM